MVEALAPPAPERTLKNTFPRMFRTDQPLGQEVLIRQTQPGVLDFAAMRVRAQSSRSLFYSNGESGSESEDNIEQPLTLPPPPMPTEEAVAAEMRALAAAAAAAVPQPQHVSGTSAPATPVQSTAGNASTAAAAGGRAPVHPGSAGAGAGTPSGPDNSLLLSPPSPPLSAAKAAVSENLFGP